LYLVLIVKMLRNLSYPAHGSPLLS